MKAQVFRARHRPARLVAALVLACGLGLAASSPAADSGTGGKFLGSLGDVAGNLRLSKVPSPIEVNADRMELDYDGGRLNYSGDVLIKHAGMVLRARDVTIEFTPGEKRALRQVTASGNVHVARGDEKASGDRAVYEPTQATVTLSGNARLGSGPNSVEGDRVVVYLDSRRAVVESAPRAATPGADPSESEGGRVRVVIMPESLGTLREDGIEELQAPVEQPPAPSAPEPAAVREREAPVAAPWKRPGREAKP
jgi:lipopolysaccharide export system protein LptA